MYQNGRWHFCEGGCVSRWGTGGTLSRTQHPGPAFHWVLSQKKKWGEGEGKKKRKKKEKRKKIMLMVAQTDQCKVWSCNVCRSRHDQPALGTCISLNPSQSGHFRRSIRLFYFIATNYTEDETDQHLVRFYRPGGAHKYADSRTI